MHDLMPGSTADRPYVITRLNPVFRIGEIQFGLRLHAAFNGNPLDLSTWHAPRGNLLWNYGGGKSGFEKIQDIATDAISLVDHISIGEPESSFYLRADDTSSIDFGLGMRAGDLRTSIDHPSIRRIGLYNRFDTRYLDYELFIDDISYAQLFGLRLAASPIPDIYDFTLGFYGIADISTMPTQMVLTPGIDLQLPIVPGISVIGDISGLMYYNYNSQTSFVYDATYNETGLHHFQAAGGLSGEFGSFGIKALANYRRGDIPFNFFGADYHHRRDTFLNAFDNGSISADGDHLDIYGRIDMESGKLNSYFSYLIPISVPSYSIDFTEDLLQAGFSFEAGDFTLGADMHRRNVTGLLEDPSTFLNRGTAISAQLSYRIGRLTAQARYTQVFTNDTQTIADPLLTLETTIELASLRDSDTGTLVGDNLLKSEEQSITEDVSVLDSPQQEVFSLEIGAAAVSSLSDVDFDGPYTRAGVYPQFSLGPVSLGLQFDLLTNGNPLTSRFEEEGQDKWDVLSLIGETDFFSIKELATDVLSFIDYLRLGTPDHTYYLRADDTLSITFGTGTMIRDLRSDIDTPLIDRTGLYSRLETSVLTHELMINDLSNPKLMASRFGFRPAAQSYPFEIGFSTIMDLTFEAGGGSATRMLLVPGMDMSFPLAYTDETTISLFADANFLAVYDRGVFEVDSFMDFSNTSWFDKLYNYNASAGVQYQDEQWEASAFFTYQKGRLESNMFGLDYSWRWEEDIKPLLDGYDTGNLTSRYNLTATAGYTHNQFKLDVLYSMRRNTSFEFDSSGDSKARNAPDIIGVDLSYQLNSLSLSLGMTKRGFTTFLPTVDNIAFFDGGSVIAHAEGTYQTEHAAFSAALSIVKDYTAAEAWAPVLALDTRIGVL
jgi:predicted porin